MGKVDELRAALVVAETEETFAAAKVKWYAGDLTAKKWQAAKKTVTLARIKQRVAAGRKGSEPFTLNGDGTVSHTKARTRTVKHRDPEGRIIPEQTETITEDVTEVLG